MAHIETQLLNLRYGLATSFFCPYMNKFMKSQKDGRKKWRPTSHFSMWKVVSSGKAAKKHRNGIMVYDLDKRYWLVHSLVVDVLTQGPQYQ